jgi:hypothetical protein
VRLRALYEIFLARFFENEATVERTDLRRSFFWLIAFLAVPGMFWAVWQMFRWELIAMAYGHEQLHVAALFDKALYLQMTSVAIGLLTAIVWPSLVLERRDGLVLGILPVRPRTIFAAKAAALVGYIGLISLGMHLGPALFFGTLLSGGRYSVIAGTIGHLVAGLALNAFVFFGVAAAASIALAVLGPARFSRTSSLLQVVVVMIVTAGLVLLPSIVASASPTLAGRGRVQADWILLTPPIWFLGLYETIAGTTFAVMRDLAMRALGALGAVTVLFAVTYPVAGRRALSAVSATAGGPHIARRSRRSPSERLVTTITRSAPIRGALQFSVTTLIRVQQHRLVIAIGAGIGLTIAVPIVLSVLSPASPGRSRPMTVPLLAVGPTIMFLIAAAVRIAIAVPSEPPARWLFAAVPSPPLAGRAAARLLLWLTAVIPGAALTGLAAVWLWTSLTALVAAAIVALAGAILVEVHLWGFAGIPCARLLAPGQAQLQARWPWYLAGFYVTAVAVPQTIAALFAADRLAWFLPGLAALWWIVRRGSDRAAAVNALNDDDEQQLMLLDLSVAPTAEKRPDA